MGTPTETIRIDIVPEGHVNRLKLVKRQMYGRTKQDLLEARLLGAP